MGKVQGSGFRVQGPGFRVQGPGFRVQGPGFDLEAHEDRAVRDARGQEARHALHHRRHLLRNDRFSLNIQCR